MKQRIITGMVGLCLFFAILLLFDTYFFNIIMAIVTILTVYELLHAYNMQKHKVLTVITCAFSASIPLISNLKDPINMMILIIAFVAFLVGYGLKNHETVLVADLATTFFMSILFAFSLMTFVYIRNEYGTIVGLFYTLIIFSCSWGADSGAYFAGRFLGKRKLAPKLSPNKTVEGVYGGVVSCLLFATVITASFYAYTNWIGVSFEVNFVILFALCIVGSLVGVLGDLFASMIKRQRNIKDFGHIMPGHGGVVDRFDSTFFIAPLFFVLVQFVEIVA